MGTNVGVGHSTHRDPERAGQEAVAAAYKQAGVDSCDFVLLFSTVGYDQEELLEAVRESTGNAPLSGCSGEGVIDRGFGDESSHAVSVMVWKSDELKFTNAHAKGLSDGASAVGKSIAETLGDVPNNALGLFTFGDGITFSFDQFSAGFNEAAKVDKPLPLIGGTAGDNFTQTKTYQYHNGEVFSDGVSVALLSGDGTIAIDVSHGCKPIGEELAITSSEGNVIKEIDGRPALDVMREYLNDEETLESATIPLVLGFKAPSDIASAYDEQIVRMIPIKDEEAKTIAIYTDVDPLGKSVYMSRRDPTKMKEGIDRMTANLKTQLGDKEPRAVIHIECMGRGKHMFREEEKMSLLNSLQSGLDGVPWVGFYAYGEIAPVGGSSHFHNYSSVVSVIA
jgi:hypothetical protein